MTEGISPDIKRANNGARDEKRREYKRRYYLEHREYQREYKRRYYLEHREERSAYRREHREELLAYQRRYNLEHREERSAYRREHREDCASASASTSASTARPRRPREGRCADGVQEVRDVLPLDVGLRGPLRRHAGRVSLAMGRESGGPRLPAEDAGLGQGAPLWRVAQALRRVGGGADDQR